MPSKCKGIMRDYFKIAFASAYKDGIVTYCGYENDVKAKQLVCGPAGLKKMLERRNRDNALDALFLLQDFEYVSSFFEQGAKITIDVLDLITQQTCSYREQLIQDTNNYIAEHRNEFDDNEILSLQRKAIEYREKCYVNDNSGFICVPRNLTERLVEKGYVFDDADAFYDLYLHTVYNYESNPFSKTCPAVMYNKGEFVLTLTTLGERWGWSISKVSRFFKKFNEYFNLVKLQSSYGCVIFNKVFLTDSEITVPSQEDCFAIVNEFKNRGEYFGAYDTVVRNEENGYTENEYINCCIDNFMSFDPEEQAHKMSQMMAQYEATENESGTYSFNICGDYSKQEKVHYDYRAQSLFIHDCFFDAKKCVLQFLTYNKTLFDIKRNYYFLTATSNSYFNQLCYNSNFTLNKRVCPIFGTEVQKGLFGVLSELSLVRPPTLALATPLPPTTEFIACEFGYTPTAEASNASPPQNKATSTVEKSSLKSGFFGVKRLFTTLIQKFKKSHKGVNHYEQITC